MAQPQGPKPNKIVTLKGSNLSFEVLASDRFLYKVRDFRDRAVYLIQRNRFA